jgi:hypothetical protein
VAPDSPTTADDGFAVQNIQQVIDRLHDASVATREVLWFEHMVSTCLQLVR